MKRNSLYALASVVAALGLWYAASVYRASAAGSLPALIEMAPAGSTMIAYGDVAALRQSPWVQQLESLAQPAQVDRDYLAFVSGTGFDYQRDLDRVMVASSAAPSGNADKTLILAEGRFDHEKIEKYALASGKLQQQNGRAIYVVPSTTPGKNVSFTFLAPDRIALSSSGDLSVLLSANPAPTLDPAMRERVSRVAGAPLLAVIDAATFRAAAGAGGQAQAGIAAQLKSLRWIALAAQPNTSDLLLSLEGECDRPEDAQKVAATLELLRSIFRGAMADPKARGQMPAESAAAMGKLLDAVKITTETVRVRLMVSLTPEMLRMAPVPAPAK